jgi:GntR family transcriptional regulator
MFYMEYAIPLDTASDTPIFQQIVSGFERKILAGELEDGQFLPSVRELAIHHSVNPNTVSKAYQILQSQGLVEPVRGLGLRVTVPSHSDMKNRKMELLESAILELLGTASSLQIPPETLLSLLQARMKTRSRRSGT